MKENPRIDFVQISVTAQMQSGIRQLVALGLHGSTPEEVAETLVRSAMHQLLKDGLLSKEGLKVGS